LLSAGAKHSNGKRVVEERSPMNISVLLAKARKELDTARSRAAADEKTARIARQTARAAKLKLKQARKLSKLAKKSARKADDQAETSLEALDGLQAKLEKLEKRARKQQRKLQASAKSAKASAPQKKRPASRPSGKSKVARLAKNISRLPVKTAPHSPAPAALHPIAPETSATADTAVSPAASDASVSA
jgi:hypothetical protein